jgi:hypothetical protein
MTAWREQAHWHGSLAAQECCCPCLAHCVTAALPMCRAWTSEAQSSCTHPKCQRADTEKKHANEMRSHLHGHLSGVGAVEGRTAAGALVVVFLRRAMSMSFSLGSSLARCFHIFSP